MHLALLRGINVGGRNIIRQDALREAFEELGFDDVRTYIQSGNVLFRVPKDRAADLRTDIEAHLSDCFGYSALAVIKSARQYRRAAASAHAGWGHDESRKHNAIFMGPELRADRVVAKLPPLRDDLEQVSTGPGAIFWSASKDHISATTMMKFSRLDAYRQVTVRNHKTTWKLLELLAG